jgi:multidrug efflux pump subunit AcrA (membrane-fusion protein)
MTMKKFVMLFTFTTISVGILLLGGYLIRNSAVQVSAVKVNTLTVENSVTCSGRVERVASRKVFGPSGAVVKEVYFKQGDHVTAGQTLMDIEVPSEKIDTSSLPSSIPAEYENYINQYSDQIQSALNQNSSPEKITKSITSPISGEITTLSAIRQGYIASSIPVAVIADDSELQVRLTVNESQISDIKVGQKAIITGVGFKNSSYPGTVKYISPDAKQEITTTGQETVVEVVVSVDGISSDIKPGYTAKAKIITSNDFGVLIAPYEAVRADKNGDEYVFKINGKRAEKTPIVTSKEFDNGFQVTSGLSKNDVIIENPDNITNGAFVKPSEKKAVSSDD